MNFFRFLRKESQDNCVRLIVVAVVAGIINSVLVAIIITSASSAKPGSLQIRNFVLFGLSFGAFVYCRHYTLDRTGTLAERIITKVRLRIVNKIRHSNLLHYERLGRSHIYTTLAQDTLSLSQSATLIANSFSSAIMVVFACAYIGFLSKPAFFLSLLCIVAGLWVYYRRRKTINAMLQKSTEKENEFFDHMNHLLAGFKEVKMHQARNEDLYENFISKTALESEKLKVETSNQFAVVAIFSQSFFYILLAAIIFIIPSYSTGDTSAIGPSAAVILFIIGPLSEVVSTAPFISRSNVAVANIERLEGVLDTNESSPVPVELAGLAPIMGFRNLVCDHLTFRYGNGGNDGFSIGPIDLTLTAGEILFIAGGNGSGKSTFLKVLTGLYPSQSGTIHLDGRLITPVNLDQYRSLFSTIFTDFHLFDRLYGLDDPDPGELQALLEQMELHDKTNVKERKFITTNLSTGQRKRLALIVANLEHRPILLFDEVAADQDPHFRKLFYEVLLPLWQSQGKTMIVVTHDDNYFKAAGRILKMADGKLQPYPA